MGKAKGKSQKIKVTAAAFVLTFYFLLLTFDLVEACPGCKEALIDPSQLHQRLSAAKGYALSIGLLLLVPLTLIATVAVLLVRSHRRASRIDTPVRSR